MKKTTVVLGVMCVLMLAWSAHAALPAVHVGATDPATEGWIRGQNDDAGHIVSEGPLSPDPDFPLVNAWQIDSGHDGINAGWGGAIDYRVYLATSAAEYDALFGQSWEMAIKWRLEDITPGPFASTNFFGMRLYDGWYQMRLGYGATAADRAVMLLADGGTPVYQLTGGDKYYDMSFVYDPISATVDFFVDGNLVDADLPKLDAGPLGGGDEAIGKTLAYVGFGVNGAGNDSEGTTDYAAVSMGVVPEPMTLILLGLGGIAAIRRRK